MTASGTEHLPNADLRGDMAAARRPDIAFAFDHPELVALFRRFDRPANIDKARSRMIGLAAVGLGTAALLIASSAPMTDTMRHATRDALAVAAAICGVIGTALGIWGVLHTAAKHKWLRDRLATERLRQLHFHWIVARFPDLVRGIADPAARAAYVDARDVELRRFQTTVLADSDAALTRMIAHAAQPDDWLVAEAPAPPESEPPTPSARAALDAYRALRLDYQLAYANAKLRDGSGTKLFSIRRQERLFARLGIGCIAAMILLHLAHFTGGWTHVPEALLTVASLWIAVIALSGRALEEGLQPQREVERYEHYRASCLVMREQFDRAGSLREYLDVMRAFERISVEETKVFLRTHARSRFIL